MHLKEQAVRLFMNSGKIAIIFILILAGCSDDYFDKRHLVQSKGISLWWDHKIFGEEGRGYIFSFYEKERLDHSFDLEFEYRIDKRRKTISFYLTGKTDQGKCPYFPSPTPSNGLCSSDGSVFIKEEELEKGAYDFVVNTANYQAHAIITIDEEIVSLEIQDEKYFSSSVEEVFPTPKNLLYGTIAYHGEENEDAAQMFLLKLEDNGFKKTLVANPPFNLETDDNGTPTLRFVEPDRYYQSFLFELEKPFDEVCEITRPFFEQNDLNIYLFSTNGDQATFSKRNGISYHYAYKY